MSGDSLDEIRKIFEEECIEGLDTMEAGLLNLEEGSAGGEVVNDIFRAAHSIKGGSATFGYKKIADFTHLMETLLDLVRNGQKSVTPGVVQLLLGCVDCLREMMDAIHSGEYDEVRIADLMRLLQAELPREDDERELAPASASASASVAASVPVSVVAPPQGWRISFRPHEQLLRSGNQPLHILRALAELGDCVTRSDVSRLPSFESLDPESLYLSWDIELTGAATLEQVREVFEWVEGECDLSVEALGGPEAPVAAATTQTAAVAAPVAVPAASERRAGDRRAQATDDRRRKPAAKEAGSIRVGIDKVDNLMNLVGELVITQAMLSQFGRESSEGLDLMGLRDTLEQLSRNTRELQEAVMQVRMLPVSVTFSRFPRLVHDLSAKLGKKIELEISGEQTELDKTVLEKIGDPLVHLIRNSLDHGIEDEATRIAAGKTAHGTIFVSASHESGNIVIRVADDGAGLNSDKILRKARERGLVGDEEELTRQQINDLIFMPGFSTADVVSDVSGRGVGMDVVRSNIQEIGGRVDVSSTPGEGSVFQITLPLTLAILDGQLVRVGAQVYVVPLLSIIETVQVDRERLNMITGQSPVYRLRGEAVPVVSINRVLRVREDPRDGGASDRERLLVIVETGRDVVGLAVDELLEQHQVVIKSLENNFTQVPGTLGATILGDGTVSLIVDIAGLVRLSGVRTDIGSATSAAA